MTEPKEPKDASASAAERLVAERVRRTKRPTDRLWTGLRVTEERKDAEIDLLIGLPGAGVVVVEVKGGQLTHDGTQWFQSLPGGAVKRVDPVRQALEAKYLLRGYVERDPRWGNRGRIRWAHAVVAPYTDVDPEFALPECPRSMIFGRNDLDDLVERLAEIPRDQDRLERLAHDDDIAVLEEIIGGRKLPQADLLGEAAERDELSRHLTEQQAILLEVSSLIPRLEVRGGAGSGKTWLATEQARRLARERKRVALLCYSRGLATYLRRVTGRFERRHRPSYVGTFHALGTEVLGAPGPEDAGDQHYWDETLPAAMASLASALPAGGKFDAVVVDEAQDFDATWWDTVTSLLKDPQRGLYMFCDEGQRVFTRRSTLPECQAVFVLEHNLRNTQQIFASFDPLTATRMRSRGGLGPSVRFVQCPADESLGVADDQVDRLLDLGWRPEDVALLTTGSRHPEQLSRVADGVDAYWDSLWDADQVFYGHVLGFKGLERRAVVLALNEGRLRDQSRERLYVGLSRATDQLVVCGDLDQLEQMAGPAVARYLANRQQA